MIVTRERLKEILRYCHDSGVFTWRVKPNRNIRLGAVAGCLKKGGEIVISVDGRKYGAHRLAWLYVYGHFPDLFVDHINRIRRDNRISNLRLATHAENTWNSKAHEKNTSGFKNVMFNRRNGKWFFLIKCNGQRYLSTNYLTAEACAYDAAVKRAELHGEFTCHG